MAVQELPPPEIEGISLNVLGRSLLNNPFLFGQQLDLQLLDNGPGYLILDGKDVREVTIVAVSPDVPTIATAYKLSRHAHPRAGLANASFQDKLDPKLLADLLHIWGLVLISKNRVSGDDEKAGNLGKVGDDILGHTVAEVLLLWVTAHIVEGQYSDRG